MTPPRHVEDVAPPTKMARNHPTPIHARGGLRAGRPTIFRSPPVGAGHARPATSPPPAVNLPPLTHSPKPPNPATLLPLTPHNLCPPTAITTIYTLPKSTIKTLSKKPKKVLDKGHTPCYNNQAVSRGGQPLKLVATACMAILKPKDFKKYRKKFLTKELL